MRSRGHGTGGRVGNVTGQTARPCEAVFFFCRYILRRECGARCLLGDVGGYSTEDDPGVFQVKVVTCYSRNISFEAAVSLPVPTPRCWL